METTNPRISTTSKRPTNLLFLESITGAETIPEEINFCKAALTWSDVSMTTILEDFGAICSTVVFFD